MYQAQYTLYVYIHYVYTLGTLEASDNVDPLNGIIYCRRCDSHSSHGLGDPEECFKASGKNMSLDHTILWCENRYIWYELTSNFNTNLCSYQKNVVHTKVNLFCV